MLLSNLDRADKMFSGTAPSFVRRILLEDPVIVPLVGPPRMVESWLWRFSADVSFLVYALAIKRL